MKASINFFIIFLSFLTLNCKGKNNENIIPIGGSTTATAIMEEMIIKYKKINPNIKITYDTQGSSIGINGIFDGIYKMAISSRDLTEKEIENGAKGLIFAIDALVFVINPDLNITNITEEDLAKILNGTIRNWKQAGGPNANINFINRDSSSGTYSSMKELILKKRFKDPKKAEFVQDGIVVQSNGEVIEKVSLTKYAIGYIGIGYIKNAIKKGLKLLSINGIYPTQENTLKGDYKIKRNLLIITNGPPSNKNMIEFIKFILSSDGQDIVEEQDFIRINQ